MGEIVDPDEAEIIEDPEFDTGDGWLAGSGVILGGGSCDIVYTGFGDNFANYDFELVNKGYLTLSFKIDELTVDPPPSKGFMCRIPGLISIDGIRTTGVFSYTFFAGTPGNYEILLGPPDSQLTFTGHALIDYCKLGGIAPSFAFSYGLHPTVTSKYEPFEVSPTKGNLILADWMDATNILIEHST